MAAKGKVGPFFSQPTVVADLTAHWMANVSTKLLALVDRGLWTFDRLMEACPPLPPRPIGVQGDNGIYVYIGKSITQNVFNLVYFSSVCRFSRQGEATRRRQGHGITILQSTMEAWRTRFRSHERGGSVQSRLPRVMPLPF